uniref:Uncharacterized protein n=1 Tax=Oryza punctata TaxID=4537 RepID=A0A0E0M511_ORYPU
MESLPVPFVAAPTSPTPPPPSPPNRRLSLTPAPLGFGRTGTLATRTGEPAFFTILVSSS